MSYKSLIQQVNSQLSGTKYGNDDFGRTLEYFSTEGASHSGYFSSQNPWLSGMRLASSGQDLDAAYERAMEWESDFMTLQEQRAFDKEVLEEQRKYDSPIEQLKRQRAAGYNPDIDGSSAAGPSGGGPSAQLAQHQMADQSPQTPFKNAYKDRELRLASFSNAIGLINGVSSLFTSAVSGISTIKQLPSKIALTNAQANAANASANQSNSFAQEIQTLLAGKKQLQSINNAGQILNVLSQMQGVLSPDTDISPILTTMGVPDDKHEDFKSAFSEFMNTPAVAARTSNDKVAASKAGAAERLYTDAYWLRFLEKSQSLEELSLDYEIVRLSIQNKVQSYLAGSEDFAQSVAEGQIMGAQNELERQKLFAQQISVDAKSFAGLLEQQVEEIRTAEARLSELAQKQTDGQELTNSEWNEFEYLQDAVPMMKTLNSSSIREMFSISRNLSRNRYLSGEIGDGSLQGATMVQHSLDIYFNDVVNGALSATEIAHMWTNSLLNAIGIGANAYVGNKLATRPQQQGQVITNQSVGYDGTMQTTSKQTIQTLY